MATNGPAWGVDAETALAGGAMGALVRAHNWAATPLGPLASWEQSVKTALSICLTSRFPILLWLGPELRIVYNDAYIPFLGDKKHPAMLGEPGRTVWGEVWDAIGPMHEEVLAGRATYVDDFNVFFVRHLPREEVYVSFSYSPILGDDGRRIVGVFCACIETTAKVIGVRRLSTLRDLGALGAEQRSAEAACRAAAQVLTGNPRDIPFAAIYVLEEAGAYAQRVATVRLPDDAIAFPAMHALHDGTPGAPWPLGYVAASLHTAHVGDLSRTIGAIPAHPWPEPVETAFVLPLAAPSQPRPAGFLIVGVSARRVLDAEYRSFLGLVAGHIARSIADARAFEAERRRAEALAALDRAKTTFFSNVSHEFRTPLTLLLGPLEEALAAPPEMPLRTQRAQLESAHRNSLRLLRLVNTLLDFARLEAGRLEAVYEPVDLAAVTIEMVSLFRSAIEGAGLRLMVDWRPLPEPIYVDRAMWEKIVLNLLSNAFKFTFAGAITVTLRWGGDHVALAVSDTGTGIPAEELPHLFERFHRVRDARGRTVEGSGIGLALMHDLVQLHGGHVHVDSVVGTGSTFTVTLPTGMTHLPPERLGATRTVASTALGAAPYVEEARHWAVDIPPREAALGALADRSLGAATAVPSTLHARVLVVDDNADMRAYLRRLLAQEYDVELAGDGAAALERIQQAPPDLVLTDVMLPHLDGFALLRALRADPRTVALPILLLSARAGEEARVEGLEAGADDYLVKPFAAPELLARVGTHLQNARLRRLVVERERREALLERVPATVLIATDDTDSAAMVDYSVRLLWPECAVVLAATDAATLRHVAAGRPDLVVLDGALPTSDVFAVCRRIRQSSSVPILLLMAGTTTADKVRAFDVGADDYLTTPLDALETLARLRALVRRAGLAPIPSAVQAPAPLPVGGLTLDPQTHEVEVRGRLVPLTDTEYRLLEELARHADHTLPHSYLLAQVWGPGYEGDRPTLRVAIQRLRAKLGDAGEGARYIHTERHIGYRFRAPR